MSGQRRRVQVAGIEGRERSRGQALVEFSLASIVFFTLLMAIFDFGLAIYQYNGVSEAAREVARTTSLYPGTTLGSSPQTAATLATQRTLIPNLQAPTFTCVDVTGTVVSGDCASGDAVKVRISAPWTPRTPLLGWLGTFDIASTSSVQVP